MDMTVIGVVAVIVSIVLTHAAMLTFYKRYRYWWNYYSDLGYRKNSTMSRVLNAVGTLFLAGALIILWTHVGASEKVHYAHLIQVMGYLGVLGLVGVVAIPYDKYLKGYSRVHGTCVLVGNVMTNGAIMLLNVSIGSVVVWLHVGWFVLYFFVWAYTGKRFRHDLKKARPVHAPVQRIYVWMLQLAVVLLLLAV